MAAMSSWQFSAWPLSPKTRAAASSALSFFGRSAAAGTLAPKFGRGPVQVHDVHAEWQVRLGEGLLKRRKHCQRYFACRHHGNVEVGVAMVMPAKPRTKCKVACAGNDAGQDTPDDLPLLFRLVNRRTAKLATHQLRSTS